MSNMEPPYGRIVSSVREFWELARDVTHFAFARKGYFHHFIVASWFYAKQKIYEYYLSFKKFVTGPGCGEFETRDIDKNEIENAINEKKLYVVENPKYPKTDKERKEATERFWSRWGERAYSLALNNCETIVNYILTGIPVSKQIENIRESEAWKMVFVETIDVFISSGKRNLFKASCSCLIGKMAVNYFLKSMGTTLMVTGLVEGIFALYEVCEIEDQEAKSHIRRTDASREKKKICAGAVGATAGSVAGAAIGQLVLPVPVLGYAVGSFIGNLSGRAIGRCLAE